MQGQSALSLASLFRAKSPIFLKINNAVNNAVFVSKNIDKHKNENDKTLHDNNINNIENRHEYENTAENNMKTIRSEEKLVINETDSNCSKE